MTDSSEEPSWEGIVWAAVGDSLTENNKKASEKYHKIISERTGITVLNYGRSGTGYGKRYSNFDNFSERVLTLADVDCDVITIFGSMNDLSIPLGTADDTGTDTLGGWMNTTFDNLEKTKPDVPIGVITPTPCWGHVPTEESDELTDYSDMLIEIAKRRNIPVLDLYRESGFQPNDKDYREQYFGDADGLHPNNEGNLIISYPIQEFVGELIESGKLKNKTTVIDSVSASFNGSIDLNFYFDFPADILNDEKAYVSFLKNGNEIKYLVKEAYKIENEDETIYKISLKLVAKEIADEICVKIYSGENEQMPLFGKSGTDYSSGLEYRLLDYIQKIYDSTQNKKMQILAKALENYCISAQIYFKYKSDSLTVSDDVKNVSLTELEKYKATETGELPEGIKERYMTVLYKSDNSIRIYYEFDENADPYSYTYKIDGDPVELMENNSGYYIELSNVSAKNLGDIHEFAVLKENNVHTLKCSVLTYARASVANGAEARQNLGKALYLYSMAAEDYLLN